MLKSACAGLLGMGLGHSAAQAIEVDEATSPLAVDGDFVDDGDGTPLPANVTSLLGTVGVTPVTGDGFDSFRWINLPPNQPFSIVADLADNHPFFILSPSADFEPLAGGFDNEGTYAGVTPLDGVVRFQVNQGEGGNTHGAYALSLAVVPEPGTAALALMGAAALLGSARRQESSPE